MPCKVMKWVNCIQLTPRTLLRRRTGQGGWPAVHICTPADDQSAVSAECSTGFRYTRGGTTAEQLHLHSTLQQQ